MKRQQLAAACAAILLVAAGWAIYAHHKNSPQAVAEDEVQDEQAEKLELAQTHARCAAFYYLLNRRDIAPDQPLDDSKPGIRAFTQHAQLGALFAGGPEKFNAWTESETGQLERALAADTAGTKALQNEMEARCAKAISDSGMDALPEQHEEHQH